MGRHGSSPHQPHASRHSAPEPVVVAVETNSRAPMLAPVRSSLANNKSLNWNRVALLPGYVYFRHDIHVAKGVGCVECHGRIDTMALTDRAVPLTMQFCLDCHRDPGLRLRPSDQITNMAWQPDKDRQTLAHALPQQYGIDPSRLTHCNVCHR